MKFRIVVIPTIYIVGPFFDARPFLVYMLAPKSKLSVFDTAAELESALQNAKAPGIAILSLTGIAEDDQLLFSLFEQYGQGRRVYFLLLSPSLPEQSKTPACYMPYPKNYLTQPAKPQDILDVVEELMRVKIYPG